MTIKYQINTGTADKKLQDLKKIPELMLQAGYKTFLENTPIKSGNARRSTKQDLNALEIQANYAYAQRLDSGWSSQSPGGMSGPAQAAMKKVFEEETKRAGA